MALDGISKLIGVTQQKAENANDGATSAAEKQKSLVAQKQSIRAAQSAFETLSKDSVVTMGDVKTITGTIGSQATIAKPADYLSRFAKSGFDASSKFSSTALMKDLATVGSNATRFASGIGAFMKALKKAFEDANKGIESQGKTDNFAIQNLMSSYNEATTLASSTKKKTDDQSSSVIGKI